MADPIEEIKSKLDIVDIIREYFPLQQAGGNFRARCPFHEEKSASFMVSRQKQIWHCFGGCNEGGDVFQFLMKYEGMEFGEALRYLAEKAGVYLDRKDPVRAGQKTRLFDCMEAAAHYVHQALLKAPSAQHARAYIGQRIPDESLCDEFAIGYTLPDYSALSDYLLSKKFTAHDIIQSGLAIQKDHGYGLIDRFRNRIMIPIHDIRGQVIGFGGRTLDESGATAKYINSPQTPLYDKSSVLFNLHRAKQDMRTHDAAIIVEGYMDTIAVYGSGMKHVVASSGTALTVAQIRLLNRFTKNLLFAFDMDMAGTQATLRGIHHALQEGMNVRVIRLPMHSDGSKKYKDPDECIRADREEWNDAVVRAQPFMEFSFDHILTASALTDGFEKKRCTRLLLEHIMLIPDRIEQDHWIRVLAERVHLSERVLWEELSVMQKKQPILAPATPPLVRQNHTPRHQREELFLAGMIKAPSLIALFSSKIRPEMLLSLDYRALYDTLLAQACPSDGAVIDRLALLGDKEWGEASEHEIAQSIAMLADSVRSDYVKDEIARLQLAMNQAERAHDVSAMEEYARQFSNLQHF